MEASEQGVDTTGVRLFTSAQPTPPMLPTDPDAIARIIHLTDLHLHFAYARPRARLTWLRRLITQPVAVPATEIATWLISSWRHATADSSAFQSLMKFLRELTDPPSVLPTVLAQTGDVEAFGQDEEGRWRGFERLFDQEWPQLEHRAVTCIDMYGNHDIWPPLLASWRFGRQHAAGPRALATAHEKLCGPYDVKRIGPLVIHRLVTVDPSVVWGAILARGEVGPEPVRGDDIAPTPPLERLARDLAEDGVHIVLTHHPIDRDASGPGVGQLRDAQEVAALIGDRAIVLSGHTHTLFPDEPRHRRRTRAVRQLVAPSSTVRPRPWLHVPGIDPTPREEPAFAVYHLVPAASDTGGRIVRVDRHVFHYSHENEWSAAPHVHIDVLA
jgi:hypothetical protein